jgi:hypothetical protein
VLNADPIRFKPKNMSKEKLFLTLSISVIILTSGLSQDCKQKDLRNIDSISSFFHPHVLDDLYYLDNYFTDYFVKNQSNIDSAYKSYLVRLIKQINDVGTYYSCDLTMLTDLAKVDLKTKLSPITYSNIFRPHLDRYYIDSDTLFVYWDNINVQGQWIKFLNYYSKTDTILTSYVKGMESSGTFPMFLDTLDSYVRLLDFNCQTHRLIVIIHLMGRSSTSLYDEC